MLVPVVVPTPGKENPPPAPLLPNVAPVPTAPVLAFIPIGNPLVPVPAAGCVVAPKAEGVAAFVVAACPKPVNVLADVAAVAAPKPADPPVCGCPKALIVGCCAGAVDAAPNPPKMEPPAG